MDDVRQNTVQLMAINHRKEEIPFDKNVVIQTKPGTEEVVQKGENGEKQQQQLRKSINRRKRSRRGEPTEEITKDSGRNRTLWR